MSSSIKSEIKKFTSEASKWWDVNGPFKLLHEINPLRLEYILEQICSHYKLSSNREIKGFSVLDVGCGGGVLSVPLARLGADVTAIDSGKENIEAAQIHAQKEKLEIDFICTEIEEFSGANAGKFDIVLCMEVLEHVANPELFISYLAKAGKKDSIIILSTINRNLKSGFLTIGIAEYILKMLPKNTHDYNKFITPAEMNNYAMKSGLEILDFKGMTYDIFAKDWVLSRNIDVNYFGSFRKTSS